MSRKNLYARGERTLGAMPLYHTMGCARCWRWRSWTEPSSACRALRPARCYGAALTAAGMGRAGYGFDALFNQGGGNFYGQTGGSLASSGNVLEFNGQWGFALCWGGKATAATSWYPDYPTVMNIAKNAAWGSADLFPQFGMPSL